MSLSGQSRRTLIRKNYADRFDPCGRTATPDIQQLISAQQKVHNSLSESSSRISILQVKSTMEKRTGVSVGLAAAARLSSCFPGFDHNRSTAGTVALSSARDYRQICRSQNAATSKSPHRNKSLYRRNGGSRSLINDSLSALSILLREIPGMEYNDSIAAERVASSFS